MLVELRVRDLGVIEDLALELGPGMTAITGETGAGKTLVVEAVELLVGGRAEPSAIRQGAVEAVVEGRFVLDGREVVLQRIVARSGRSRAYVDGRMATVSSLAELGDELVDIHGQHAHQSLLSRAAQRDALDRFAGTDVRRRRELREAVAALAAELEGLGGDERATARELDLLRYELSEIEGARVAGVDEDERLAAEEERLATVGELREAMTRARLHLAEGPTVGGARADAAGAAAGDALGALGAAMAALAGRDALADLHARLAGAFAEVEDVATELRRRLETLEEDPERLEAVQARRRRLRELTRRYGKDLAAVLDHARHCRERIAALEGVAERRAALEVERATKLRELEAEEAAIRARRQRAAPSLADAVGEHLSRLGMSRAVLEVRVGDDGAGDDVEMLLSANPGEPPLPLAKVASGGELARAMLALRLVCSGAPPTLVFDEVDAGIGGAAATAVGRSLGQLARGHQVLVVTHLAQVASFAQSQVVVTKEVRSGRSVASATVLDVEGRRRELARMLSGHPDSPAALAHADELLARAAEEPAGAPGATGAAIAVVRHRDARGH